MSRKCPHCGGSLNTWKCTCTPIWPGYAEPTPNDTHKRVTVPPSDIGGEATPGTEREAITVSPTSQQIADKLRAADQGFMCPLCGRDYPHPHSSEEITIYRNGMKWERNNGGKSWTGEDFARAAKDAPDDAGASGGAVWFGADEHHEHRARQPAVEREDDQRDRGSDGLRGAGDVPKTHEPSWDSHAADVGPFVLPPSKPTPSPSPGYVGHWEAALANDVLEGGK